MLELLSQLHDALGDKAALNVLIVVVVFQLRRLPVVLVALAMHLARVGRVVGVPDEETGRFLKTVRAATQPHPVVVPEGD